MGADQPTTSESARLKREGQARIRWGSTPIDLFFSYYAYHDECGSLWIRKPLLYIELAGTTSAFAIGSKTPRTALASGATPSATIWSTPMSR